jgi:hypothetical protein
MEVTPYDIREFRLAFGDPSLRIIQLGVIKVLDLGGRKRFAENGHARFPFRLADDRQSLDVFPMLVVEFQVLPQSTGGPTMELVHFEQNTDLAVLLNPLVDHGRKDFIIFFGKLPRYFGVQQLAGTA